MPQNVLMVVLDAARRDAFEPYGAAAGSTPAVAQLASRGTALQDVYATSCWTVPSHASMFTGLLPRAAGLAQVPSPAAAKPVVAAHQDRLLAEVMRRAGYSTGAVSANLWVSAATGFDAGFDDFAETLSDRNAQIHLTSVRERLRWVAEAARARADDGARAAEATLQGWLADPTRRPFFWFVNLLECHSPYLPPKPYGDVSVRDRVQAAQDARRHYTLTEIWRTCAGVSTVPAPTLERLRRMYNASIRSMDDWLGRMLERLDAAGVLDETLVIVLSDHGENFGDGGLIAHGLSLDQRLIHVPFVAAGPGAEDLALNSLADLPRAVAQSTGAADHPWRDGPPAGFGVAQFDPPVQVGDTRGEQAMREMGIEGDAFQRFATPLTCAVAGGLKLLQSGNREAVYDLVEDPLEIRPLDPADVAARGRGAQVAALRDVLGHPSMTLRRSSEPAAAPGLVSEEERRDLEERMKLLGYM